MTPKVKNSKGIAHLKLIIVAVITLAILIVIILPFIHKTQNKPSSAPDIQSNEPQNKPSSAPDIQSNEPQNIGIYEGVPIGIDVKEEWETYVSPEYNYIISNPGDWILYINDFANSDISLRLKSDSTPTRHGFSIAVFERPKYTTMKEMCDNGEINESTGILCSKEISTSLTKIGTTSWERISDDSIGVVPNFNIVLSTFHDNKIFYVVSEGYSIEQISEVLESFRFIK